MTSGPAAARARLLDAQRRLGRDPASWADRVEVVAALRELGRPAEALEAAEDAARRHPGVGAVHLSLGRVQAARGAAALAERAFARATASTPSLTEAWLRLGTTRFRRGDVAGAEAPLRRAHALDPGAPATGIALASLCLRIRRAPEACALLEPLLDGPLSPELASTWARACLATGAPRRALGPLALARRAHPADPLLCFAAGDVHDRIGQHQAAFDAFDEGNRRMGRTWDAPAHAARVDALLAAFDAAALRRAARSTADGGGVVWIVGMPRSGTSLLEQALACHPAIAGGGELDLMRRLGLRLSAALGTPGRWFSTPESVTSAVYDQLAAPYLDELSRRAGAAALRIDKTPDNALHLGLGQLVLPGLRVLELVRDPVDTGWSCFRQAFGEGLAWSRGLDTIAAYQRDIDRALAHWRAVLPTPPVRVAYEALVGAPEATLRGVLSALGLPWDPAVLRPNDSQRLVATASHTEVQQALHGRHVGRSAPYRAWLGALGG